jgi:hypothetical protein
LDKYLQMFKALEPFNSEFVDTSQQFKSDLYFSAEQGEL